ncbi:hypothetical protein SAMN05444920_109166 [Nonomuraea solani]|uniref:Uncharacterized protein n=1 Tax=Nonomuraea solani TaxID=1144553 RepID=A0A1H6EEX1_9ACTN|nr:hypothetical protein [Nonomuraea solani]SEG95813.1 hypothetical protein SAMN05444920_109166 [Nonomuraea solani]
MRYLVPFSRVGVLISRWSRRTGWSDSHRVTLAGGALLTYAWAPIMATPVSGTTDLISSARATFSVASAARSDALADRWAAYAELSPATADLREGFFIRTL